jgi:hypothetical protein
MLQDLVERSVTACSALLNVAPDCNRVGEQIGDVDMRPLLATPMSRAVWMRALRPLPAKASNGRMSVTQKSAEAVVILDFCDFVTFDFLKNTLVALAAGLGSLQTCLLIVLVTAAFAPVLNTYAALHDLQAAKSCVSPAAVATIPNFFQIDDLPLLLSMI